MHIAAYSWSTSKHPWLLHCIIYLAIVFKKSENCEKVTTLKKSENCENKEEVIATLKSKNLLASWSKEV